MKKNNKRTIFYSWISSYVCLSLVLIIIYTPIMFAFKNKITKQTEELNRYTLSETAHIFDSYVDQAHKSVLSVLYGNFINKFENIDQNIGADQYLAYENREYMMGILRSNPDVENIAIYFTDNDYIVTQNGIFDTSEYYNIYYAKDQESFSKWKDMLYGDNDMFLFDFTVGKKLIYKVNMSKSILIKKKNCIVFSEVNELAFQVKIEELYNKTQNNLIVTDKITGNNISYNYDEDSQYIFFDQLGADSNLNYSLAIRKDKYLLSSGLIRMMYISILMGLILSSFLAWYFSRKNYKPIKKILKNYQKRTAEKNKNEFELIEMYTRDIDTRLRKFERDNVMLNFLNEIYSEEDILKLSEYYDTFVYDKYVVAVIMLHDESVAMLKNNKYTQNDIRVIFTNILEELLNEKYPSAVVEINRRFCCVINLHDENKPQKIINEIRNVLENAQESILKHFGVEFNTAIGNIVDGYEGIGRSFEQAMSVVKLSEITDVNKTIFYSDVSLNNNDILPFKLKMIDAMKKGNVDECFKQYNLFVDKSIEECETMEKILFGTVEILSAMMYVVLPTDNIECVEKYDCTKKISKCETVKTLKNEVFEYILSLSHEQSNFDEGKKELEICDFIKNNYADQNLSVSSISDIFSLHPVYLSRMFKEKIGQTPIEYITKIRIDEACKLLSTTVYDVKVIAEFVGYSSAQTFSRAFKKAIGMSPGNYRAKFQSTIAQYKK